MFSIPTPKTATEAAQQANVQARANVLFTTGGYRPEKVQTEQYGSFYFVHKPEGEHYTVSPEMGVCTCPFWKEQGYCKHALAIEALLETEAQAAQMEIRFAEEANGETAEGCDPYAEL